MIDVGVLYCPRNLDGLHLFAVPWRTDNVRLAKSEGVDEVG